MRLLIEYFLISAAILILFIPLFVFIIYRYFKQRKIRMVEAIHSKNGIQLLEPITIGNTKQWIEVRGEDVNNPVLLFLHGGPGFSMMPSASDIHKSWEKYFTVVQWDQRGTGKTYRSNRRSLFDKTMNIIQMDTDLLELVNFLRKKLNKEKIYILGHSWGTILGLRLAHAHPELLHAYFGIAQVINTMENETLVYQQVLNKANEAGNKRAMRDLERIKPYPAPNQSIWQVNTVRKWSATLLSNNLKKGILANYMKRVLFSPQYSLLDIYGFFRGIIFSAVALSKELMMIDFTKVGYQYHIPIIFMHGKNDYYVSPDLAKNYLYEVNAPYKSFILFDQSSHFPFSEERENFMNALKNITDSIDYPIEK